MVERTFLIENRHLGMEKSCNVSTSNQALPLMRYKDLASRKVCIFHTQLVFCMHARQPNVEFAGVPAMHALPCAHCQLDCFACSVGYGPAGQNYIAHT